MSRPTIYTRLNSFPKEISAITLASTARLCIKKFQNDYKIGSFFNLLEWRCSTTDVNNLYVQKPRPQDYTVIVTDDNVFQPSIMHSMQHNSRQLSAHLKNTLCLSNNDLDAENIHDMRDIHRPLYNAEILEIATRGDLPIFVSIDGSLSNGSATVSCSIVAPDIKHNDIDMEWQHRPAKALLIRSWKLPQHWGTSPTCINMAEALGFIIGEYSIPSDLPIIYITDSNNARTLQQNLKNGDKFTHRKMIRCIKQGIDHSIANHLEYLISKWPRMEQLSAHTIEMYKRGEAI